MSFSVTIWYLNIVMYGNSHNIPTKPYLIVDKKNSYFEFLIMAPLQNEKLPSPVKSLPICSSL